MHFNIDLTRTNQIIDQFIRLGRVGYSRILENIITVATHLTDSLQNLGFLIMSKADGVHGIPVVAFQLNPRHNVGFDEFTLSRQLERKGWLVPAYHMADGATQIVLLRVVCRMDFTRPFCDRFIEDVRSILKELGN